MTGDEQKAAEQAPREEDDSAVAQLRENADREARRLGEGPGITLFGGKIPYRTLLAIAVFVGVFLLVWVPLWAALGGVGLGLGWIPAAAAGAAAVWLLARRSA